MGKVSESFFVSKAALPEGVNPLPRFRDAHHDKSVALKKGVDRKYSRLLGLDCGRRVLPYLMQDRYNRDRTEQKIFSLVLENRYLKAVFLPTLGGRLISLYDKEQNRELLYCNKGLQVGNLANRDAWFAGGIEWNIGQYGHSFTTSDSVFCSVQKTESGDEFLRIYDFDRCKELWWSIDFHLPPSSRLLYAHVSIINMREERTSLYYWTNTAVPQTDSTRVFSSATHALYLDPARKWGCSWYGDMKMPDMEICPGVDASYPARFEFSEEYFLLCEKSPMPWESSIEADGTGFFEASTPALGYRKMFCWGHQPGGRNWQRYLSPEMEAGSEYLELQSGLAPSQLHGLFLEGKKSVSWTQAFGSVNVDSGKAHAQEYESARQAVEKEVYGKADEKLLAEMHLRFEKERMIPAGKVVHKGYGWPFIEKRLQGYTLPETFSFDESDVSQSERFWLDLVDSSQFAVPDFTCVPPPCVVSDSWVALLRKRIAECDNTCSQAVLSHYLGIALLERDCFSEAYDCFSFTMAEMENVFTARNLAVLEERRGGVEFAKYWYERLAGMDGFFSDISLAEETFAFFVSNGYLDEAGRLFDSFPDSYVEKSDRIALQKAVLAEKTGDAETIKKLVFDRELAIVREGEVPFESLWYSYHALEYAASHNTEVDDRLLARIKQEYPLPEKLDFSQGDS